MVIKRKELLENWRRKDCGKGSLWYDRKFVWHLIVYWDLSVILGFDKFVCYLPDSWTSKNTLSYPDNLNFNYSSLSYVLLCTCIKDISYQRTNLHKVEEKGGKYSTSGSTDAHHVWSKKDRKYFTRVSTMCLWTKAKAVYIILIQNVRPKLHNFSQLKSAKY